MSQKPEIDQTLKNLLYFSINYAPHHKLELEKLLTEID